MDRTTKFLLFAFVDGWFMFNVAMYFVMDGIKIPVVVISALLTAVAVTFILSGRQRGSR